MIQSARRKTKTTANQSSFGRNAELDVVPVRHKVSVVSSASKTETDEIHTRIEKSLRALLYGAVGNIGSHVNQTLSSTLLACVGWLFGQHLQ